MKQNNQNIDLTKVDLTQLDSESMDRLIDAFKGTQYYKNQNKIAKNFAAIIFLIVGSIFMVPVLFTVYALIFG